MDPLTPALLQILRDDGATDADIANFEGEVREQLKKFLKREGYDAIESASAKRAQLEKIPRNEWGYWRVVHYKKYCLVVHNSARLYQLKRGKAAEVSEEKK